MWISQFVTPSHSMPSLLHPTALQFWSTQSSFGYIPPILPIASKHIPFSEHTLVVYLTSAVVIWLKLTMGPIFWMLFLISFSPKNSHSILDLTVQKHLHIMLTWMFHCGPYSRQTKIFLGADSMSASSALTVSSACSTVLAHGWCRVPIY